MGQSRKVPSRGASATSVTTKSRLPAVGKALNGVVIDTVSIIFFSIFVNASGDSFLILHP